MAKIFRGRFTAQISAQIEEPFIVLILGIRVNRLLLFWKCDSGVSIIVANVIYAGSPSCSWLSGGPGYLFLALV